MSEAVQGLETRREDLYRQLRTVGDFRRGSISVNYGRCGRANCACVRPHHAGHGPQYLWHATIEGKSRAQNLRLGPELEKVGKEVENYRRFVGLSQELVEVNERICRARPVREVPDPNEWEELKKKLRKQFSKKWSRK